MFSVYVLVTCDTEDQAENCRMDMEDAAGKNNAELIEAKVEYQGHE